MDSLIFFLTIFKFNLHIIISRVFFILVLARWIQEILVVYSCVIYRFDNIGLSIDCYFCSDWKQVKFDSGTTKLRPAVSLDNVRFVL